MLKEYIDRGKERVEVYSAGLERTKENCKLVHRFEEKCMGLFYNEKYCKKVLECLERSRYRLRLEENEGNDIFCLIKINEDYYECVATSFGKIVPRVTKELQISLYEKIDLNYYKNIVIQNLISIVKGDLSLGDKKIIKDIAIKNLYSNLEKAINIEFPKICRFDTVVGLGLCAWPRTQLRRYGFELKPSKNTQEIKLNR